MPSIILIHHPYQQRGGEDVHVESLAMVYHNLGFEVSQYPAGKSFDGESTTMILQSLRKGFIPHELKSSLDAQSDAIVHLHNIHPIPGVALLEYLEKSPHKVVATIHNHRMYCTNGLGLYRGQLCYECRDNNSKWRPIRKNCNQDLKRSTYYSFAISKIRASNLWDRAVDQFWAPSDYIVNEIQSQGIDPKKISLLPHPVVLPEELSGENSPRMDEKYEADFVYFGRISEEKGIRKIIEIAKELPNQRFRVIGDGPMASQLQAKSLKNIEYFPSIERIEALKLAKKCRFAMSLSTCNESFSMWPVEAALLGLPSLVSDLPYSGWMKNFDLPIKLVDISSTKNIRSAIDEMNQTKFATESLSENLAAKFGLENYGRQISELLGNV